jgi:inner membrane protein YidH
MRAMSGPSELIPEHRVDATRRTHLANERTYLAWLRSGLTSLAVGLGVAKFIPDFAPGTAWPYVVLGIGFCLLGLGMIVHGVMRLRDVTRALERGEFGPLGQGLSLVLGLFAGLLGILTIVIMLADR